MSAISKLESKIKDELEEVLDEQFPKGRTFKRSPRGRALVLFAEGMRHIRRIVVAFGGCTICYGKGYHTQMTQLIGSEDFGGDGFQEAPKVRIHYCVCDRGTQLKKLFKPL